MKELLRCLMQVQNLVTLILTVAFLHLAISGMVAADQFLTIFSVVIAFYFGSQTQKISCPDSAQKSFFPFFLLISASGTEFVPEAFSFLLSYGSVICLCCCASHACIANFLGRYDKKSKITLVKA